MNEHLTPSERELLSACEFLWIILANVSGGDWTKQTKEWQDAAAKARDGYHDQLKRLNAHGA